MDISHYTYIWHVFSTSELHIALPNKLTCRHPLGAASRVVITVVGSRDAYVLHSRRAGVMVRLVRSESIHCKTTPYSYLMPRYVIWALLKHAPSNALPTSSSMILRASGTRRLARCRLLEDRLGS